MIVTMLLVALLAVAMATDLRRRKVYNWLTYPGILSALGLNSVASVLETGHFADECLLDSCGLIGLPASAAGLAICGFMLLTCYVFFKVGGGDVKLMAMCGAFLGPERGIQVMLWTFVFGGCMGLIALVWRVGPARLAAGTFRHLAWMARPVRPPMWTPEETARLQPPLHLAPSALAAALVVQLSLLEWAGASIGL